MGGEVAERQLDRTRPPRRARRVDDERHLVLVRLADAERRAAVLRERLVDDELGLAQQVLALARGEPRVDGHGRRAQQQAGVQGDDERAARRQRERDAVAGRGAAPDEPRRPARGGQQQLAVREALLRRLQRDGVGAARGCAREPGIDLHEPEANVIGVPVEWTPAGEYEDIRSEVAEGIAKITINRPEVRNAFRPETLIEISDALERAREDGEVGVIVLTGEGPDAFCSGGDQRVRGDTGYVEGGASVGRFHVTDLHVQIRRLPKPVVAMVAGYAIGGGHVLHLVCDLTIAADNARFGQVGPKVGSFDGGFGASLLSSLVGPKKAKEFWLLCRQYDAQQALEMGLVNTVVPLERLEEETVQWCREMLALSPFALRLVKASFHAHEDGFAGIQQLAHDANLLFYASEEAQEGREAYKQKRTPDFSAFPRRP